MKTESKEEICDKCKELCGDFIKSKLYDSVIGCRYNGFNFSIWTSPKHKNWIVTQKGVSGESGSGRMKDCLEILLNWNELQLEDAIRLAKVTKNV